MSSCHLLLGRPLDLFPLPGCHSVQRLVHLLSFILAVCPAHLHFCFSVYSIMSVIFVLFLISEHGNLSCSFRFNIYFSIALWAVLSLFVIYLLSILNSLRKRCNFTFVQGKAENLLRDCDVEILMTPMIMRKCVVMLFH